MVDAVSAPLGVDDDAPATEVHNRIRARWPELPAATLRVAAVVLEDLRLVLDLPINELAERASTSPATVTRFCRQIGYSGYVALRMSVASDTEDHKKASWFSARLASAF